MFLWKKICAVLQLKLEESTANRLRSKETLNKSAMKEAVKHTE
jgi:hypothetical protein